MRLRPIWSDSISHEERLLDNWIAFKHARGFQNLKERRIFSWRSALIMSRRGGATYCPKLAVAAVCDRRRCRSDVIALAECLYCATCKPLALQRLKEGVHRTSIKP